MITVDEKFFPVTLQHWNAPFTLAEIQRNFDAQKRLAERALEEDTWLASITLEGSAPTSTERKWIAEATKAMPRRLLARTVGSFCIIEGAVSRGVLTALTWMIADLSNIEAVATPQAALDRARAALEQRGAKWPTRLDAAAIAAFAERVGKAG